MPRERVPQAEVLAWLAAHYPELHQVATVERAWIWLPVDLRQQPDVREAIRAYGFRFARRGHPLSNGKLGTWAHSCIKPLPFKHRGKSSTSGTHANRESHEEQPNESLNPIVAADDLDKQLAALLEEAA